MGFNSGFKGLKNFGIINFVTKLHLVGISTESSTMHGPMNIKYINAKQLCSTDSKRSALEIRALR